MSRQVRFTLVVEVDEDNKNGVRAQLPSLDELWKLKGVHTVSFTTRVGSEEPKALPS